MRTKPGWWIVGLVGLLLGACGTSDTTSGTGDRSGDEDDGATPDVGSFDDVGSSDVGGGNDGGTPACDPGAQECRGGMRATCSRSGVWVQDPCPPNTVCQPGGLCEELVIVCGDGVCEPGEEFGVCPQDCAQCGDGICEPGEAESGCRADCPVDSCGNGVCERGEDSMVCPVDCIEDTCGDGVCQFEEFDRCRQDCRGACRSDVDCEAGWFCNDIEASTGIGLCQDRDIQGCGLLDPCRTDSQCAAGEFCTSRCTCERITTEPWTQIAVVSATVNESDLFDTTTPGPDLDAIELVAGGQSFFAEEIIQFEQGFGGQDGVINNFPAVDAMLGPNDAIPTNGGVCDLDNGFPRFWSMGDPSGYVIVEFGREIRDGALVTIWELNDIMCDNVSVTRSDVYEVYVGRRGAGMPIGGQDWLVLGASPFSGGVETFTVALP